jgi:hypothetical protein
MEVIAQGDSQMRYWEQQDIDAVYDTVALEIRSKMSRTAVQGRDYAFGAELLTVLVHQIVIPIMVSLSGRAIYEGLASRVRAHTEGESAKKEANEYVGKELSVEHPLTSETREALKNELIPLGFTAEEIEALYRKVQSKLLRKDEQPDGER